MTQLSASEFSVYNDLVIILLNTRPSISVQDAQHEALSIVIGARE